MTKEPRAPRTFRLPPQLDAELQAYADQLGLSVNAAVITLLAQALRQSAPQRKGRGSR